jgi:hypothetical protein
MFPAQVVRAVANLALRQRVSGEHERETNCKRILLCAPQIHLEKAA